MGEGNDRSRNKNIETHYNEKYNIEIVYTTIVSSNIKKSSDVTEDEVIEILIVIIKMVVMIKKEKWDEKEEFVGRRGFQGFKEPINWPRFKNVKTKN